MAVKTMLSHIAACDVCGIEFDETGDYRYWDNTPKLALAWVETDDNWVLTPDQRVVCPKTDTAHDEARGFESPVELRPGADALTVTFADIDAGAVAL